MKLLIANRGEIAIRIARAAADLDIPTVAVHSEDDQRSLHVLKADAAAALRGSGARAYLDGEQLVAVATSHGCDAVHPGYGFLSENAAFAERCIAAGLTFVGPAARAARALRRQDARACKLANAEGVPVIHGISEAGVARTRAVVLREAPQRFGNGDQGRRRRRRPRHADRRHRKTASTRRTGAHAPRRTRRSATMPCTSNSSSATRATSKCRSSATQRGDDHVVRHARLHVAAPPSEADRGGAGAALAGRPRGSASKRRPCSSRAQRATSTSARSNSWSTSPHDRFLLHRSECTAAGRAHRHRDGDRRRSRSTSDRDRARQVARRARLRAARGADRRAASRSRRG